MGTIRGTHVVITKRVDMFAALIFCYWHRYDHPLSVITTLPVPWYISRRGHVCLSCKIALQNISPGRNCNPVLLAQIRATHICTNDLTCVLAPLQTKICVYRMYLFLCAYLWWLMGTIRGTHVVITKRVDMFVALIFCYWHRYDHPISVITTLPVPWYISRRGHVCLSCKIALQNISPGRNCNPVLLAQIRATHICTNDLTCVLAPLQTKICVYRMYVGITKISIMV